MSVQEILAALQGENPPDVIMLNSDYCDLSTLLKSGLLADLSGNDSIRGANERLYEPIRKLLCAEDGRILAVPVRLSAYPVYWNHEAWEAAGLAESDVPQSFEELLSFLESWTERIRRSPEKLISVNSFSASLGYPPYGKTTYALWLTDVLLTCWEIQANENPVSFDSAEFIMLAQRTRDVAKALTDVEPARRGSLSLFDSCLWGGKPKDDHTYACILPMRLRTDQPALVRGHLEVLVVREGSAYAQECIEYLEHTLSVPGFMSRKEYMLFKDYAAGPAASASTRKSADSVSAAWLNAYAPEILFFYQPVFFPRDAAGKREKAVLDFAAGTIDPETFARALDSALK